MRAARGLTALVAAVLSVRVLGLSLVLPGFPEFGASLGGTLAEVGFAFGAYGLTMALLQVPFGALSDRMGRRYAIVLGLGVAAAGHLLAAWAPDVAWLTAARLLQGAGAVNGVAMALLAERVPDERRTTALAWAGAAVGGSFVLGLVAGAALLGVLDLRGLFVVNALLNAAALVAVVALLDAAPPATRIGGVRAAFSEAARPPVLALDVAAFAGALALQALLFHLPGKLTVAFGEAPGRWVFAAAAFVGGGLMFGAARRADRGRLAEVSFAALAALGASAVALLVVPGPVALVVGSVAFFAAHATLSTTMPSALARVASPGGRGAAQGSMQTFTSLGVAAGGTLAGTLAGSPWGLALALAGVVGVAAVGLRVRGTNQEPLRGA